MADTGDLAKAASSSSLTTNSTKLRIASVIRPSVTARAIASVGSSKTDAVDEGGDVLETPLG